MTPYTKTRDDRGHAGESSDIVRAYELSRQLADLHYETSSDDREVRRNARRQLETLRIIAAMNRGPGE